MDKERAVQIANLNDKFRKSFKNTVMTPGVMYLDNVLGLAGKVQNFIDFTEDNDPCGEHDFGSFEWKGNRIFWKIDYFDQSLIYGEDPLSEKCRRVMTIMLVSEY
jgi:hypothetical protein